MKRDSSRTPRNYQGTQPPAKYLSSLLGTYLTDLRVENTAQKEEVFKAWFAIIGDNLAQLAIPISWEKEVLTVKVKGSTFYSLLSTKEKPRLLKKLRELFPSIRNIIFRIGGGC